jgi:hypothetical protein
MHNLPFFISIPFELWLLYFNMLDCYGKFAQQSLHNHLNYLFILIYFKF